MTNKKISEEMMGLNEELDTVMCKLVATAFEETGLSKISVDSTTMAAMDVYKLMFKYLQLTTELIDKNEALMAKMDKALDIFIQKNGG